MGEGGRNRREETTLRITRLDPGVYQITHIETARCYLGSSANTCKRMYEHRRLLRNSKHYNRKLQRAWDKHGESAFSFAVLEQVAMTSIDDVALLLEREQFHIDTLKPHYNLSPTAGSPLGCKHGPRTPEYKEIQSARMKEVFRVCKRVVSPEGRASLSAARKGLKLGPASEERKRRISEANKRIAQTEEYKAHRASIEEKRKKAASTPEVRAKIAASVKAITTPEHMAEMTRLAAEANRGCEFTEERRRKISEALTGRKMTPEQVEANRQRALRYWASKKPPE